jgi:hypothetical protein
VAVPLRMLAEAWIAYYWPFVAQDAPLLQGVPSMRDGRPRNDVSFRPHLTELRRAWERIYGPSGPAGGWHLVEHMRVSRTREQYSAEFHKLYRGALRTIQGALRQPIQYAGAGTWTVFDRPRRASELEAAPPLPGTLADEVCLRVPGDLWAAFHDVSLWVEALCIHEWSLFTERVGANASRGEAYSLLTERPDNRLPLDWERNHIDILMDEGQRFDCPWTGRPLGRGAYQLDHIVPVSVYPFHELWNLVPSDPRFNMHHKRARLPGGEALRAASVTLEQTYTTYGASTGLSQALRDDVGVRFAGGDATPRGLTVSVARLVESIASARNVARF